MSKRCCKCKRDLPITEFWKSSRRRDGLKPDCKECAKENRKAWIAAHPEKIKTYHSKKSPESKAESVRRWRENHPSEYRRHHRRTEAVRRARKRNAFVEVVDPLKVFERDGGICGICSTLVDPKDFHIDHIQPLAKGGEHSYENSQLAHPICNSKKGASF